MILFYGRMMPPIFTGGRYKYGKLYGRSRKATRRTA